MSFPSSIKAVPDLRAGEQPGRRAVIVRRALRSDELSAAVDFEVALRMRNFPELQARIARGEVIPSSEMAARYWPAAADHDRVLAWFNGQGLTIVRTDPNRLAVFGRASVAQLQQSFQTAFARVAYRGAEFTSAVTAPSLPSDVAAAVAGIHGLQPHIRLHPIFRRRPEAGGSVTPPYLPGQIAAAYGASGLNLNGSGQTIAIIENAYPSSSDLTEFWTAASTGTTPLVETVNIDGGPASPADSGSTEEATLDVEWSGALAPGATIRVYGSNVSDGAGFDKTYQQVYADSATVAGLHQFSISFGGNENELDQDYLLIESQYMANLASAGIAIFVASGDGGSNPDPNTGAYDPADPIVASYPTSDPDVTGVGGTTLTLASTGAISTETAWSVTGNGSDGTGGAPSAYFTRPAWQTGTGVPAGTFRLTPDVAASGDPNYGAEIILSGRVDSIGGTSWATPTWAAFCALTNQSRALKGMSPIGLLNPRIYPLIGTAAFHDITSGNNGAYSAGVGYDLCTGIGTPNVASLIQALSAGAASAPVIIDQLGSQAVTPGQIATFAVAAEGTPPLIYQWQRLPWGGSNWYNLADNGTYGGSATADLAVSGTAYSMDGDQFRCVVSNLYGSAAGASAALAVEPVGVTTLAGWPDAFGSADGAGRMARFNSPGSVRIDSSGNTYVADSGNDTIRKITPQGVVTTVAGTAGVAGSTNGAAGAALFNAPSGVAVDSSGNLYVADNGNYEIREISSSGVVSTIAGSAGQQGTSDGTGTGALFYDPQNLALDGFGNLYVVDGEADTVRKVVIATGAVTTIAGSARRPGSADGTGSGARFDDPVGVATDSSRNVYVADLGNDTIRLVTPAGVVTTLAGLARSAGSTDGTGTGARFDAPSGVAVDSAGDIFVADSGNDTVREISPALAVTTIAGAAGVGENIDGLASNARFDTPGDIALDRADVLYIADTGNNTVRRFVQGSLSAPAGTVATPPPGQPIAAGSSVTMSVNVPTAAAGANLQWQLNGAAIPGATGSAYSIPVAGTADAGVYTVVAANEAGSTTLPVGSLQVTANAWLANLSARAFAGSGSQVLVAGFSISGSGSKNLLIRGVGPTLSQFGVSGVLANPQLALFDSSDSIVATNIGWGNAPVRGSSTAQAAIGPATSAVFSQVYAYPFPSGSADCAMLAGLPPASYTAQVSGVGNTTGVALAELFDADTGTPTSRLVNISARANASSASQILIAGFVIDGPSSGSTSDTVLIRAVGPTLSQQGISGPLAAPELDLYDSNGAIIATNIGWGNPPTTGPSTIAAGVEGATAAIFSQVFAYPLPAGSADCAMVVTLPPGSYTAQVKGVNGASGVALVEVYSVP
ncbi:MAG: protease pro-enzyme activation domain-containing protein [Opitutaceae bacterium]